MIATSSGFMTYARSLHPQIAGVQEKIANDPGTVLLLPWFDKELCIRETVRRQLDRSYTSRDPAQHRDIIGQRVRPMQGAGNDTGRQ
ncbi:MAG: hypothetical protein CMQ05_12655 [Gammaproteobacteria bacterium]|nr:hypothetical protein [Gammaproteobacteria bacterium]